MDRASIPYSADAEQQRLMDMQQCSNVGCIQPLNTSLEDELYPERKAKRIQAEFERKLAEAREEAVLLSDRQLLEKIYVMLKMKCLVI